MATTMVKSGSHWISTHGTAFNPCYYLGLSLLAFYPCSTNSPFLLSFSVFRTDSSGRPSLRGAEEWYLEHRLKSADRLFRAVFPKPSKVKVCPVSVPYGTP